jgi:hypothetical protein
MACLRHDFPVRPRVGTDCRRQIARSAAPRPSGPMPALGGLAAGTRRLRAQARDESRSEAIRAIGLMLD